MLAPDEETIALAFVSLEAGNCTVASIGRS